LHDIVPVTRMGALLKDLSRSLARRRGVRPSGGSQLRRHAEALERRALILRRILIERRSPAKPRARGTRVASRRGR